MDESAQLAESRWRRSYDEQSLLEDEETLAKILENRNHMPASNFQRIMGDIDKPVPKPMALAELDELVGEE